MDAKEAVSVAKLFVGELFADEDISDVLLEEIIFDELPEEWRITIGFDRPTPGARSEHPVLGVLTPPKGRVYKVVTILDETRQVRSVTDRALPKLA